MKTIRSKFMVAMLSISVIVVLILSIVSIRYINQSTLETSMSTIKPLAEQTSNSFDAAIKGKCTALQGCISAKEFTDSEDAQKCLDILKRSYTQSSIKYSNFSLFDENGNIVASYDKEISSLVNSGDVREAVEENRFVVTDLAEKDGNKYFSIISPTFSKVENVAAACVTIDSKLLNDIIDSNNSGQTSIVCLVDNNGDYLAGNDENFVSLSSVTNNEEYRSYAEALSKTNSDENGSDSYRLNNQEYIIGYSQTSYFNGRLVIITEAKNFTGSTSSIFINIIIIGGAVLIFTVIISVIFAKRITDPIVSTTTRIRSLAQGNLTDPVDVLYSKDELGILTHSLSETIDSLRQYINLITVALTQISDGNLCHRMEGNFKGDFYKIKDAFNDILNSLSDTFASINTAAEQVNTGAMQVSNSAQDLSQGSTQQASAIEELSATLNDIAKQIQQNSRDAKNVYSIVSENTSDIDSCNKDMTNMLNAMNAIHDSTGEIAKIIKVIDEISFQTNILALNAAVEAAREGSKGFGVVADEVRRLASRSAEAAKQTAALIENSTAAVSKGSQIADETAKSLNKVVERSAKIQNLVKNITDASEDQANAIIQINTGVDQISAVVSANTATAIGAASASEKLSSQSLILKNMIARFKLTEDDIENESAAVSKPNYDYNYGKTAVSAGKFDYNGDDDTATVSKFDYSGDDDTATVSKFDYNGDDEPAPISKFDYSGEEDEELERRLTENNDDDKY